MSEPASVTVLRTGRYSNSLAPDLHGRGKEIAPLPLETKDSSKTQDMRSERREAWIDWVEDRGVKARLTNTL